MTSNPSVRWTWNGTTSRAAYLGWGFALMAIKYNVDRALATAMGAHDWRLGRYWRPSDIPLAFTSSQDRDLYLTLLYVALPFILAGVILTVRRLRDAGWPLWLTGLFFIPVVNLVFFAALGVAPTRTETSLPPTPPQSFWWKISPPALSAITGIVLAAVLGVPLIYFGTMMLHSYGWGLFVAVPFFMGMFSALVHSASHPRTLGACCGVAALSVALAGLLVLILAIEGLICVLMAAPVALILASLGGVVAYLLQSRRWSHGEMARLYGMSWIVFPLALVGESAAATAPPLIAATTSVIVAAPPATVWRHVVTFSELPAPRDLIFRSGIAYPVRARILGHGPGAIRHCEFSTGPFVEPITVWDEPRRLAFDVTQQPEPMRELSPYPGLHPPHLDGFFRSRRGEFRLTPLSGGRTRLEGTTWYEQDLWPNRYWRVWSDYLVHHI
ncbi:MAG: hypothetical protein JWM88_1625, partial [Verrucomicrobia bacterium]|nr:hypothetical protein [Verrucomicrobiota bacterium]